MPTIGNDGNDFVIYAYDQFARADGSLGTSTSGHAWTVLTGAASIASQAATLADNTWAVLNAGQADMRIEADVKMGGQPGIAFRAVDSGNLWFFLRLDTEQYFLLKKVAGANTLILATNQRFPAPTGQVRRMGVACYGPNITCLLDGVPIFGCVDSTFATATKHGIAMSSTTSPTAAPHSFDNLVIDKVPVRHRRPWLAAKASAAPEQLTIREHDVLISGFSAIPPNGSGQAATNIREQDGIIYDPGDPNPARRYKFYVTAYRGDQITVKELFVQFSADGVTWTTPALCDMGGRNAEDPSVVTRVDIESVGEAVRDTSGKLQMYVEDYDPLAPVGQRDTIYGYVSTDGVTWTQMPNNPAVPLVGTLQGSPIARWDGTKILLGYEVIDATAPYDEHLYMAFGQAGALTPGAHNPVWSPGLDPLAVGSIVCDTIQRDQGRGEWVFLAHDGQTNPVKATVWRGKTTVMDPTQWKSGDIRAVGGNLSGERTDITLDASDPGRSRVVLTNSATGRVYRAYLTGQTG